MHLVHAICRFFIVYWSFTLFCREFVGANIFGPFLYLCYFNRFFHLWMETFHWKVAKHIVVHMKITFQALDS